MKRKTHGGALYFVTFINDATWAYSLKTKDKILGMFKHFNVSMEREINRKLKCVPSKNGGEFINLFDEYFKQHGIRYEKTMRKTPSI